jgi:glucose/arabinose dehydrogenase
MRLRLRPVLALVASAGLVLVAAACGGAGSDAGETGDAAAASAFRKTAFARGFDSPVLLTWAPGERRARYVVEQPGRILRLVGSSRRVFLDIRNDVTFGGEQGLLGLAFHPRYERNHLFYVAYTSDDGRNVVERFRAKGGVAVKSSRKRILAIRDPYGNHNGGHVTFGPDGLLYTSIGDGGAGGDPEDRAQNMRSRFGKLLTLDTSKARASWRIAALGLRNPWRFTFDRETGDLYIGDVGQNAIEEIDFTPRQSPGLENYGWDLFEGSDRYEDTPRGPGTLVAPVFEYSHNEGCSVTGGYVYRGGARPVERGRYLLGDYCSGTIWSFRIQGGEAAALRREPFSVDALSSFGEDAAGELYAVSHSGTIYRLT